jgi:hypothetical protein
MERKWPCQKRKVPTASGPTPLPWIPAEQTVPDLTELAQEILLDSDAAALSPKLIALAEKRNVTLWCRQRVPQS